MDDFTIKPKLDKLNTKIEDTKSQLDEKLKQQEDTIISAITKIKADVTKSLDNHISQYNNLEGKLSSKISQLTESLDQTNKSFKDDISSNAYKLNEAIQKQSDTMRSEFNTLKKNLMQAQDTQDRSIAAREILINNSLDTFGKKIDRMHFDIIDNHDNIAVTYINPDGKVEYGAIKKVLPDDKTIKMDIDNKLYLNYTFDSSVFSIDKNNIIRPTGFYLNDKVLSASRINNDLNNATSNIQSLSYKIERVLQKLNTVNGYVASNNFKSDKPSQEALTDFVLSCLSDKNSQITKNDLNPGTKVKNTYDNHIWILNKITKDGLSQIIWEDFGSDNICIASNNGIHGLVCGSQDKLKGFVDIKGVISINGLEEELNNILTSILTIKTDIAEYKLATEAKLAELEAKISSSNV